ncbi:MAG: hypothetical protein PHH59_12735 [Methylovulum sp.]|uniref:hypothetical protein n=1 Tax=Methylovulum sp. TaxID=1916980 RepID=UPI00261E1D18|nr:hypothetical protein [Methylovulum sp.]MDD2724873.1 hypothetical protein [Methylovulum sp.]MDD5125640.1 hypothetical protein [Methylovulum sp.]
MASTTKIFFAKGELDELSLHHGTDKSSDRHDYMRFYEFYFSKFKEDSFTLLELGVGPQRNKGKSLLTWRDYFQNANIVGVDIRPDAKTVETERVDIEIGDLSSLDFLSMLAKKYPSNKIVIDDASHFWSHQILSFEILFQTVADGGIFVIEDINTSFSPKNEGAHADSYEDAFTYFSRLTYLVGGRGKKHLSYQMSRPAPIQIALAKKIDAICFQGDTIIIVKK